MKKIFVVLFLLITCNAYSQRIVYPFGQSGIVRFSDSSKIFTVKSDTSIRMLGKVDFPDNTRFNGFNYFYNGTYFYDSLNVSGAIVIMDSLKISDGITWGGTSSIRTELDNLLFKSIGYQFLTQHGTQTATLDSVNGFHLYYGVYTGDGSGLTALNGSNISTGTVPLARLPIDTTKITYTDRSDTINGIYNFDVFPTVAGFFRTMARTISYWLPVMTSSDTAVYNNHYQTLTNKTISGTSNTLSHVVGGTFLIQASFIAALTDATTYYIYGGSLSPSTSDAACKVYVPRNITIRAINFHTRKTTPASSENVAIYIRVAGTTDYTVSTTMQWTTNGYDNVSNTSLNGGSGVPVSAGSWFNIKIVTPTWGTDPANIWLNATVEYTID